MTGPISRRHFSGALMVGAASVPRTTWGDDPERDYPAPKFQPKFAKPLLGLTLVRDFVIFAHSDLEMVRRLLEKEPALLNATVDWGAGDFESALGGASHMGRRDIAEFLIAQGARIDLFAAAMLGHVEVVKGLLSVHPNLARAKGPHGIPLVAHAKAGGEPAREVLAHLETILDKPD